MTPPPMKPTSGLIPNRKAPEPPVVATSVKACPAKDWLRTTVKTPTTAETTAVTAPMSGRVWTGPLREEPGLEEEVHARSGDGQGRVVGDVGASAPGSATTRTRPWSLSTSTWWP